MKHSAIITATVAAGSTATAVYVDVDIQQQFCKKTCVASVPVFAPVFTVAEIKPVGTSMYELIVNVQGSISYNACHECGATVVPVNQNFVVPVYSVAAIESATIVPGIISNSMIRNGCRPCSSRFDSKSPLTITLTAA